MKSLYTYACSQDEESLCAMEQRALFGKESQGMVMESLLRIDPGRSPFITGRLDVLFEGGCSKEIARLASGLQQGDITFKVQLDKHSRDVNGEKIKYEQRRAIEREIGLSMQGIAELDNPQRIYGILILGERWYVGEFHQSEAVWLRHKQKPQAYSTALSTRVARAVVNIAVPDPTGLKVIDPCCGIGTVLIEALSMGIDIVGRDINPLVTRGARKNIAHFGLIGEVVLGAIEQVQTAYDVAIIDMPYNLCSTLSGEEQLTMLQSAARIAGRIIIITIEPLDALIMSSGLTIEDRCIAKKGGFERQVIVCRGEQLSISAEL